jgi:hypothetical protein
MGLDFRGLLRFLAMGMLLEIATMTVLSNCRSRDLTDFNVIPSFQYVWFACVACNRLQTEALHCLARMESLVWVNAEQKHVTSLSLPEMQLAVGTCQLEEW